ncbi:hypothetical protein ONS95_000107 [Cadophora gregata]|uniref:uncharacterized protein n=1 Tax=Cadophora gregata TaxID=51156 RepID=UPI0026DC612E|nr:uncharacterized protein ONS95_000107 [Cadophora gregata]KAK0128123.1 hypothetical protein ONS95_000107 [Cadophora gregata]
MKRLHPTITMSKLCEDLMETSTREETTNAPLSLSFDDESELGSLGDGVHGDSDETVQDESVQDDLVLDTTPQQHPQPHSNVLAKWRLTTITIFKSYIRKVTTFSRNLLFLLYRLLIRRTPNHTTIITRTGTTTTLPTTLLTQNSKFFSTMLQPTSPWLEQRYGLVFMPSTNSAAFRLYSIWLTTHKIEIDQALGWFASVRKLVYVADKDVIERKWVKMGKLELLVECYILGDYLRVPFGFLDLVMSHIIDSLGEVHSSSGEKIPLGKLQCIWEKAYPTWPLRDVVVDTLASCLSMGTMREAYDRGILSEEIIDAVIDQLDSRKKGDTIERPPWKKYSSRYFIYACGIGIPWWDAVGYGMLHPYAAEW